MAIFDSHLGIQLDSRSFTSLTGAWSLFSVIRAKQSLCKVYFCIKCGIMLSLTFFSLVESISSTPCSTLTQVYNSDQKELRIISKSHGSWLLRILAPHRTRECSFMFLGVILVSKTAHNLQITGIIFDNLLFLWSLCQGFRLDFEVGPSNEYAAATSFKAVVQDFSDLGAAALELWLKRDRVLWRIIISKCYSQGYYLLVSVCDHSLSQLARLGGSGG